MNIADAAIGLVIVIICIVFGFLAGIEVMKTQIRDILRQYDHHPDSYRISLRTFRMLLRGVLD